MTLVSPLTPDPQALLQSFLNSEEHSFKDSPSALESIAPIIENFLCNADLFLPAHSELLDKLDHKVAVILYENKLDQAIRKKFIKLINLARTLRTHLIPGSTVSSSSSPYTIEPMKYMPDTSCASILVCADEDAAIIDFGVRTFRDKTPLILPSRIFAPMIPHLNESILPDTAWWIYQTNTRDIIVCLPKQGEETAMHALQKFGYDAAQLNSLNYSELTKTVQKFEGMTKDAFLDQICLKIPQLFINPRVKKRVHILGHGGMISGECYVLGMKIRQAATFLDETARRGMDYCNLITCHGGKHLLQLLGNQKRSYTVSICSIGDFPVITAFKLPENPQLQLRLTDTARFWNSINDVLAHSEKESLTAEKFTEALEYIYGHSIQGTPLISLKDNPRFRPLNVQQRISILDSSRVLAQKDQSFIADSECILIIPPVIEFPILLKKSPFSENLPRILSPIPDDNHLLISALKADDGSILQLMDGCLRCFGKSLTSTRVVVIKEFSGRDKEKDETYLNIVAFAPPNIEDQFIIFQKKDQPNKWFARADVFMWPEREVDAAEVRATLHHLMHNIKTKTEASSCLEGEGSELIPRNEAVIKCYNKWFENLVACDDFIEGLEALDNNNIPRLQEIAALLDGPSCRALLLYAAKKNNLDAIPILGKNASDIDKPCISGKRVFVEAILHSTPEIVEALLKIGCLSNVVDYEKNPLKAAIEKGEEAKVEILCRHGACLKGIPEECVELNRLACLDVVLKYLPKEADLSPVLTRAIETDQFDIALRLIKEKGTKMTPACLQLFMDKKKKIDELLEVKRRENLIPAVG